MIKYFIGTIALVIAFQSSTLAGTERVVSARIKHLISVNKQPTCDNSQVSYCYLFPAIVDIDRGYLRVWKVDIENNWYVSGQLEKGEIIYVRGISKDKKYAYITVLTSDCMNSGCMGRIDLRYIR